MPSYYVVIQFMPNPITDERINIGVLAFDDQRVCSKFISRWDRVRQFAGRDVTFLKHFSAEIEAATNSLPLAPDHDELTSDLVRKYAATWTHSIQFTEPRGSLKDVDELIVFVDEQFLFKAVTEPRGYRDRRGAAKATKEIVKGVLDERLGEKADHLFRTSYEVKGEFSNHEFDAVVANGRPYFAAHGLSFELPKADELEKTSERLAWTFSDIRKYNPDFPIAVLILPPQYGTKQEPKVHNLYTKWTKVYQGLKVDVLNEENVESWTERMVAKIDF